MSKKKPYTYQLPASQIPLVLRDMATAIEYGSLPSSQRIQVKMPSIVVEQLDTLFPEIDRSRLLTSLALDAILRKLRFKDRPDLADLVESEQDSLDEMFEYLEKRESNAT